jgi:hypothetical protein
MSALDDISLKDFDMSYRGDGESINRPQGHLLQLSDHSSQNITEWHTPLDHHCAPIQEFLEMIISCLNPESLSAEFESLLQATSRCKLCREELTGLKDENAALMLDFMQKVRKKI